MSQFHFTHPIQGIAALKLRMKEKRGYKEARQKDGRPQSISHWNLRQGHFPSSVDLTPGPQSIGFADAKAIPTQMTQQTRVITARTSMDLETGKHFLWVPGFFYFFLHVLIAFWRVQELKKKHLEFVNIDFDFGFVPVQSATPMLGPRLKQKENNSVELFLHVNPRASFSLTPFSSVNKA